SCSRRSSWGAPPRKSPWKETDPMALQTLRRTGGHLSAVPLVALFAGLLLLLSGAPASAAQRHHKRGHHATKHRATHRRAKRAGNGNGKGNNKPPASAQ